MTQVARYAAVVTLLVAAATAGLWPVLDPAGRLGVLVAAAVALPLQVVSFGLMVTQRRRPNRWLAAWVGGTLGRMAAVLALALLVVRVPGLPPAPTLLALAAFLFGMLLIEPVFFRRSTVEE